MSLKTLRTKLAKKFGEDSVLVDKELKALAEMPYGISCQSGMMNLVIGRPGFPAGRLTEIVGAEASAKSTIGFHLIAECQRMGGQACLIETEEAFETDRLHKLGIKVDELLICSPKTMEDAFEQMQEFIIETRKTHKGPIVVIFDSIASTPVLAETEGDFSDDTMAAAARFLSKAMRKFGRLVAREKVVLVFMNQLKATLDLYSGEKFVSYGGRAIKFRASIRLWVKTRKSDLEYEGKDPIGTWVQVQNIKNKVAVPFKVGRFFLKFKSGLDQYRDCWEFGIAIKKFKDVGKGRIHYKGQTIAKKKFKEFVKKYWGGPGACRDFLMTKAIKREYLKPYIAVSMEDIQKDKKSEKKKKEEKTK